MRNRKRKCKYRAAIIGCGRIGFGFDSDPKRKYIATHAGAYNFVEETELVAVCDSDRKKLKKCVSKYNIPNGYTDVEDMIRHEKLDILSICTPEHTHYPILRKIVDSPLKAIFCEKPLAGNVRDAKEMAKLCKENKIILQVDHQRRFDPLHVKLKELIGKRKLGGVQQVNFYYTAGIRNTGSHMFDLLRFFFGEAEWIEAFFSKNVSYKENDPNLDGIIKFKNGNLVTFQACDVKKYLIFELNCFLDAGRFILKKSGFSVGCYKTIKSSCFSGYKELKKTKLFFRTQYRRNFMVNAVRHLIWCIENKKQSISSGMDGLRVLQLIEGGIASADSNKRVYLNEKNE